MQPELEEVQAPNGRVYQAYKITELQPYELYNYYYNATVWFEKETLIRIKELEFTS